MWWFYREKKYLLISLIIIILDGIIVYFIPSFINNLNCFYPMLTISLIPFLSRYKERLWLVVFCGIVYDLLYANIFLYNMVIFFLLAIINNKIMKYFSNRLIIYIVLVILNIVIYDSITFFLVIITNYQSLGINDLIYKIKNSFLLNIMSVFVYYFIFKKRRHQA